MDMPRHFDAIFTASSTSASRDLKLANQPTFGGKVPNPTWLLDADKWPHNNTTEETGETKAETKTALKEIFAVAVPQEDELDQLLHKCDYWRTIRITARMSRLPSNTRNGPNKVLGPLTTEETSRQTKFWVKRVQQRNQETESFGEDRQQLNLQKNDEGIRVKAEYKDIILFTYTITSYLPKRSSHMHTNSAVMGESE